MQRYMASSAESECGFATILYLCAKMSELNRNWLVRATDRLDEQEAEEATRPNLNNVSNSFHVSFSIAAILGSDLRWKIFGLNQQWIEKVPAMNPYWL